MWCLRKLLFVAAVFSRKVLGGVTVVVSEIPDPIYLTTTILIYDGTVTPTDSVATSTSFSDIPSPSPTPSFHPPPPPHPAAHVPLPGFIPKPQPANEESSSTSRLTTFITHTIPRETITDSSLPLTATVTSTSSASPAAKQSDSPPPPPSTEPGWPKAKTLGWCIGSVCLTLIILAFVGHILDNSNNDTSCCDCSNCSECCDCSDWHKDCKLIWWLPLSPFIIPFLILIIVFGAVWKLVTCGRRKKQAEQQDSPGTEAQTETTPVELDATNEIIVELSVPETRPYHYQPSMAPGAKELEGSSSLSRHPPSTSQQPAELPTSVDSGASSLPPPYEDLDTNRRNAVFSWAPSESGYRPDKPGS
ncbi:hypothetical protein J3F84DRAFT_349714 [Trichoderma pleuroticola]